MHTARKAELALTVAIATGLTAMVLASINIGEYLAQTRDAVRISHLLNLQTAVTTAPTNNPSALVDTAGCTDCNSIAGSNSVDGAGWVKLGSGGNGLASFLKTLPTDPINKGNLHYSYFSDGTNFELTARLESRKYAPYMEQDGGNNPELYERGSDLFLN